jgi:Zn-dependent metalloprotease
MGNAILSHQLGLCLSIVGGFFISSSAGAASSSIDWERGNSILPIYKSPDIYREITTSPGIKRVLSDSNKSSLTLSQKVSGPAKIETTKFQHYYDGLEVIGSMAFHHVSQGGTSIRNTMTEVNLDTHPTVTPTLAASIGLSIVGDVGLDQAPLLQILPNHKDGSTRLIYRISSKNRNTGYGGRDLLIDAHSGALIANLSHDYSIASVKVHSAQNQGLKIVPNLSKDPTTGTVSLKDCKLEDMKANSSSTISKAACVLVYQGLSNLSKDQCQVIDGLSGMPLDMNVSSCRQVVSQGVVLDPADPSAVNADTNSRQVLEYYDKHFGRNSFDNLGSELVSVVHAGAQMANAFWTTDLNMMVYGDGDGKFMGDLTYSIDVAGHEMTHGVTTKTANLMMMGESGALNEAFSDFFGKMIEEKEDWVMGRKLFTDPTAPKGIRDLANPSSISDTILDEQGNLTEKPFPATVKEAEVVKAGQACDDSNDQCWVHFNSTIPGHASYLVYQAIGKSKAELLYYTVLTQNLSATDDFKSTAQVTLNTCTQLNFSSSDCEQVKKAYTQVGIL